MTRTTAFVNVYCCPRFVIIYWPCWNGHM